MKRQDARAQIEKLITFFNENIYQLKSPAFNETQARQQLIDPFFEALGWDVHNRAMQPLFLQEVVPEGRVKTSVEKAVLEQQQLFESEDTLDPKYKDYATILDYIAEDAYKSSAKEAIKKPDYRFRINGQTKFFVEAKKPFVDLSKSQDAIFQVKRYGFSGRVPVSILTDFEQFRVFDCTHKPEYGKPKIGIIKDFDLVYQHYLDEFDRLFDTFSRDAVQAGSLDTLASKLLQKRTGDFELDKTFLEDLSKWREELARDIAKHPKNRRMLNDYTLNESVQRILDRIVFFRVCEDREIEVENTLLAILQMWKDRPGISLYSLLTNLFKQRRSLYNGLLFSPHECEELEVGDEVLIKILQNLNYPFSPYHFNEIGVEILGSIYERFLGKTIHLTAKTTRIEEKPEVRKAGGVYYTPQYIVNYIVDNTLGKLLYKETGSPPLLEPVLSLPKEKGQGEVANKQTLPQLPQSGMAPEVLTSPDRGRGNSHKLKLSPKQVAKLKIIDIACGSGSFLLGAFQKLIDYHIEWYTQHPKDIQTVQHVPDAYKDANGNLHLSARKKRDILVNNIYGVDIDRQAVEVTQMSLYLKVLEGENAGTLNPQMTLALKEVYLPSLTNNIKCGNSLIGTDFMAQGELFDEEIRHKVNPFDWEAEFPEILRTPTQSPPIWGDVRRAEGVQGFDVVIGNPPYGAELLDEQRNYLEKKFALGTTDTAALMMKQARKVLKSNGRIGFIIPKPFTYASNWERVRQFLLDDIEAIVDVSKVWKEVKLEQVILAAQKDAKRSNYLSLTREEKDFRLNAIVRKEACSQFGFLINGLDEPEIKIGIKITSTKLMLGNIAVNRRGGMFQNSLGKTGRILVLGGKQLGRFAVDRKPKGYLPKSEVIEMPENAFVHENSLLVQNIVAHIQNPTDHIQIIGTIIPENERNNYLIVDTINQLWCKEPFSHKFVLGILSSTLINWFVYRFIFAKAIRTMHFDSVVTDRIPIPNIEFNNPAEKKMHDDLVNLVERMLSLHKELQSKQFDSEREPIERQITATDKKIDALVYELYGLTEEEIKIVEGKSGG